jgi:hypothetical protein
MKIGFVAACFAAAVAISPAAASAALLTYTETADVSGSLNGVTFTDDLLTITGVGDTSSISGGPSFFFLGLPAEFTLSGGGSGTFTDSIYVVSNQSVTRGGFSDFSQDLTLLITYSSAFATYDLSTPFGPVSGDPIYNGGSFFPTTAGALIIDSVSGDATFTATIPEPSTSVMMILGFVGIVIVAGAAPRKRATA